jgi:MerR family transcriptional regulator/heat shock protein HspR
MTEVTRAVFVISVASELAGMHPQTLRIYERKGLIDPYRTPGGTRRYSQDDIERLQLIQELTSQGLNLEGVRRVLALREENRRLKKKVDRLRDKLEEIEEAMEHRMERLARSYRREIVLRSQVSPMLGEEKSG